jgi:hypothetical protein
MTEVAGLKVAVGDQVRVHFHPPNPMKSFCEGVVSRVDVTAPEGRFFVVEVTHEIILDQEHRVHPGFQDYVRYECRNDFPGRIEILSTAEQDVTRNLAPDPRLGEPPEEPEHEADEQHVARVDVHSQPEIGRMPESEVNSEPAWVGVEPQPIRKQGGLLAALFGRRR